MSNAELVQQRHIHNLYITHHGWLHGWLYRRVGCREIAADLAQDTFLRLLSKPRSLNNTGSARGYLRTVAGRLCIDMWRRKSVEQAWLEVLASRPEPIDISPEERAMVVETFCELDDMLHSLPEKVAAAFILSRIDGFTYQQIAAHLEVSERTVKTYMARAMLECALIEARLHEAMR